MPLGQALRHGPCLNKMLPVARYVQHICRKQMWSNDTLAERFVHIQFAYSSYKCLISEVITNGIRPEQEQFKPFCEIPFMNKEVSIPKQYHIICDIVDSQSVRNAYYYMRTIYELSETLFVNVHEVGGPRS